MDVEPVARNPSRSGFISVAVALALSNATCTQRFWPPISIQQHLSPRVPSMSFPGEGAEARLRAAHEQVKERANAGQTLPQSFGIPRARARLPESLREPKQEPALLH